jgi:SH3 domain-containing YSC84-like protein 1
MTTSVQKPGFKWLAAYGSKYGTAVMANTTPGIFHPLLGFENQWDVFSACLAVSVSRKIRESLLQPQRVNLDVKGVQMMKTTPYITLLTVALALLSSGTSLMAGTKEDQRVRQAAAIMQRFKAMPEEGIPEHVMDEARGLAIVTVTKGGFVWSGKIGQGVVVARTRNGWSAPSFIRTGGVGFGAQIGAQVTELVLVLNTPEAVQAFSKNANVQLGGALSVAAGPVGRSAEAGVTPRAAVYAYSRSQGLYAGISLEGTVLGTDKKANQRYYHSNVSAGSILSGRVRKPASTGPLMSSL